MSIDMGISCGFSAVNNGKHCVNEETGKCDVCKTAIQEPKPRKAPTNSTDLREKVRMIVAGETVKTETYAQTISEQTNQILDLITAHTQAIQTEARIDELNGLIRLYAYAIEHSDGHKTIVTTPVVEVSAINNRLAELTTKSEGIEDE